MGSTALTACGARDFPETPVSPTSPGDLDAVVYLIGDAGSATPETPNIVHLRREVAEVSMKAPVVVAFLGDNIYEHGLHPQGHPSHERDVGYLEAQIDIVHGTSAKGAFVPGNHDWGYGDQRGAEQIRRQGEYLTAVAEDGAADVALMPSAVCPGPDTLSVGESVLLVMLETDLWLRSDQPGEDCENQSTAEALSALARVLRENGETEDRHVLILGHHPLETYGQHGGYFGVSDQFFPGLNLWKYLYIPLPFLYPIARNSGISSQDMSSSKNKRMRAEFAAVLEDVPTQPLAWAGGHDHSLQVFEGGDYNVGYHLVSGAGSRLTAVGWDTALYAAGKPQREMGYMRVEFFQDGRVLLSVITDGTQSCDGSPNCIGQPTVRYWLWLVGGDA
jgi:hypothetical protein